MSQQQFEIQSEEIQEIIGYVPHWITRWGIMILFLVAIIGIVISYQIKYPDVLPADVLIQAKEQPGKVKITRNDASQKFIFMVKEGQQVQAGDTLLAYKNNKDKTENYTITPMAGKIFISQGIDSQNTQDYVIWVVPETSMYDIKLTYGSKGSGKVKEGQTVMIKLDGYPTSEFGFLEGKITKIMPVSLDGDKLQAYVTLPQDKLVTNLDAILPVRYTMQGKADILLNKSSIFERIFGSLIFRSKK